MKDVQNTPADVALDIDRVGVKGLRVPMVVRDRARGRQHTVALADLFVDLPAHFKGTHMSRFVEALAAWPGELDYGSARELLTDVRARLEARSAQVTFRFPYFVQTSSPVSQAAGLMDYDCLVDGELTGDNLSLTIGVDVPVMTVCPCSLAISEQGAHSQRAAVRMRVRFTGFVWFEELISIAEQAASSRVYALLKREDEKFVTEAAFANPCFVEDVVRAAAQALSAHPRITWYRVEVESFESIHNHQAFAAIESPRSRSARLTPRPRDFDSHPEIE